MRVRFPSRNIEAASCPSFSIFDGSQDWVIAHNDVVAGSSPASGTKCRSSSVVEHVFPVRFLSVVISAGRRLWVLVNPAIPVHIRSVACDGGATFSTPGNSTVAFLPAFILMGRRHRLSVIGSTPFSPTRPGSSSVGRASRENGKMRVRFPSGNIEAASCPSSSNFRRVAGLGYRS